MSQMIFCSAVGIIMLAYLRACIIVLVLPSDTSPNFPSEVARMHTNRFAGVINQRPDRSRRSPVRAICIRVESNTAFPSFEMNGRAVVGPYNDLLAFGV